MNNSAFSANKVSHYYGSQKALDSFSFSLPLGSSCGIIGPDGAGKSSLLGLISGVKKIQDGDLQVLGDSISNIAHRETLYERIAFMPQGLGHNLYLELTVKENIEYFALLYDLAKDDYEQRISILLAATDLIRFQDRAAGQLSGGMKQKLGLCCALIHDPDLLILDEPTTGVDPLSRRHFWELIENVRHARPSLTLIVATAYMEEASQFDCCVLLDNGKTLVADLTKNIEAITTTGKLDDAFTKLQSGNTQQSSPLEIKPLISSKSDIVIQAIDLSLKFGEFTAVDNVSFAIRRGEIFGFLGSNGCGKTTTMKILTGLLPASSGTATLFGAPIDAKNLASRNKIGFMSQSFSLYGELTVIQNLELHAKIFNLSPVDGTNRIHSLIERFGLSVYSHTPANDLPLGLRQRLSLAVSVIHSPDILILDEPTSGVDPAARDDFWRFIIELSRDQGVTIFLSTHFMNEAERCDRISLMHAGRVLACDSPNAITEKMGCQTLEEAFVHCLEEARSESSHLAENVVLSDLRKTSATKSKFSIKRIIAVSGRERKELLRDPIRLSFSLFGAIFMLLVFGYGISLDVDNVPFAVHDQDNSIESRAIIEAFRNSTYFDEKATIASATSLHQRLQSSEINLAIEVPAGFSKKIHRGQTPEIALWIDGGDPFSAEVIKGYALAVHLHVFSRFIRESSSPSQPTEPINIITRFIYNQDVRSVNAIAPGVIALILAMIPAMLTALGIVREKEFGTIHNFYSTPLTPHEFLIGKQIPYIFLSAINASALMTIIILIFGVPLKGDIFALILGTILYILTCTSLGLLISSFTHTQIAAILGTIVLTAMPAIQFSGLISPRSSLTDSAEIFAYTIPAGYYLDISVGTFTKSLMLAELWDKYLALIIFFLSFTLASVFLLKKHEI